MSTIGLYDMDMAQYIHTMPNLEIMKMSTYYKKTNHITSLCKEWKPDLYTNFIVRKDYNDGNFPIALFDKNITYGGLAFTNNLYNPLPLEIESCQPDIDIYKKYYKEFVTNKANGVQFNTISKCNHFRLSLNGKDIWNDFRKQLYLDKKSPIYIIHDYNINNIKDATYILKDLSSNKHYALGMKFPIIVNNYEDLRPWFLLPLARGFFEIQYQGVLNDEELNDFAQIDIVRKNMKKIIYNISYNLKSEDELIGEKILQLYRQIIFLRNHSIQISLIYDSSFFVHKEWERVIDMINNYSAVSVAYRNNKKNNHEGFDNSDSMYSFAKHTGQFKHKSDTRMEKEEIRFLFQFVRENCYELFSYFYNLSMVKLIGGKFVDVTTRNSRLC